MRRAGGFLALLLAAPLAAQQPSLTIENIFGRRAFAGRLESVQWLPQGGAYLTMEPGDGGTTDVVRVDAATGERGLLVRGADLVPPGETQPIAIEAFQCSTDCRKLLIFTNSQRVWRRNTKGTYYVWDVGRRVLTAVSRKPGLQMFAKFSPDGSLVGFVRDNDVYVTNLGTGAERRLTTDGGADVINGTADWVYEEELDLRDGFRFSPDGRRVAFWRFDQSPIPPFYLVDELPLYPELMPVRYPKAGTENSRVRLGVVSVAGGPVRWVDTGRDSTVYLPRMEFAGSPDSLWYLRLNRRQNRLQLLLADANTGKSREVMTDRDSAWVEVHEPIWLASGRQFLFLSERDGYRQLFLYERSGRLVRKVTSASWDVMQVYGVDQQTGTVYFSAAADGPLTRPLYAIGLDGRGFRQISTEPGTHAVSFDPALAFYVDTYSRAGVPPLQRLHRADGELVREIGGNAELGAAVETLGLAPPQFLTVPTSPGVELNAYVIRPPDFDPARRYPLLMYVYGGPGSQMVTDAWGGDVYLWHQLLAREGYVVACVDNRGTGGRGSRFKKVTYLNLGTYESADQIAAARHFAALPYVDPQRLGIWGGSYGGYMALLSLLKGDGVFKAAIARAPVTDWQLYDTIYTERYMRTPQENPQGYRRAAVLAYAGRLEGKLLLVHGTGDDNVHLQNTIQLLQLLEETNKQFDLRLYPNKTHALAGASTQVNLYTLYTEWLKKNL